MPQMPDFCLTDFLPYLLNRAAEESGAEFARIYKDQYGLLRTEWRVLFHLGEFGTMTATEIGQRARIHKTKISRAVASLQKRRLLMRTRMERDRRQECLTLTRTGTKMFEELAQAAQHYNTALLADIPANERAVLTGCLHRLQTARLAPK
ncbi:MAG: MarR family transcriptional regulator [Rhodobacteraceae bacterium]|nr:MarR family transcriptional regulator [Paracoccaceae bacterium]